MGLEPLEIETRNQKRSADSCEMAGRPSTPRQHATSVTKNLTRALRFLTPTRGYVTCAACRTEIVRRQGS